MAKILIKNLRHIVGLNFEIPQTGVWVLTGANGTGKTSLLGCIRRIGFKNAFPTHFPSSRKSERLDSYEGASIEYETPQGNVTYTYRTERWVPTPRTNGHVLNSLGYPEVIYVAANAERIEPMKDDFSPKRVRAAPQNLINAANKIFCTDKFDALKTINTRKGVGSQAFLLELPNVGRKLKHYFSEKNLSLGELCILKLLRALIDCPRGSLILIDELELALHPSAQTELLGYLNEISIEKSLTIIVSSHSATLIKQSPRNKILYLQKEENGLITCTKNCFPSFVLGALAYREEAASDVIIYVEDEAARAVIEQLASRFISAAYQENTLLPTITIIAVGGFANVLRFYVRQKAALPSITRAYVMLDADAESSLDNAEVLDIVGIYRDERASISFLPFTPEVGLATYVHAHRSVILNKLRIHYMNNNLALRAVDIGDLPAEAEASPRKACKRIVDSVCETLAGQLANVTKDEVRITLFKYLGEHTFTTNRELMMRTMGNIVRV